MAITLDEALRDRWKRLQHAGKRGDMDMVGEELAAIDRLLDQMLAQRARQQEAS